MTQQEAPVAQRPGLRIGSIGGVPVYIGRTWPLIALLILVTFGPSVADARPDLGAGAYAVALAYAVLLLLSVLAHEAAHALVGRACGYSVSQIVADLWGGHTTYETADTSPGRSALVAVVGPLANGILAIVAWLLLRNVEPGVPGLLITAFIWTNAFVALFNLLPGLPLDGGFLIDSLVWKITGDRNIGLIAAGWCGRIVTVLVLGWIVVVPLVRHESPSLYQLLWGLMIGGFLWVGATQAIRSGTARRTVAAINIASVWRPSVLLPPAATVADTQAYATSVALVVADGAGRPVGLVDPSAVLSVPADVRSRTPVSAVATMQPFGWVVRARPEEPILAVVEAMQATGATTVAVQTPDGRIPGLVDLEALNRRVS